MCAALLQFSSLKIGEDSDFQLQLSVVLFLQHPQLVVQVLVKIYLGSNLKLMR